jgi:hypothetical protein
MMRLRTLIPLLALAAILAVIVFTALRPAARAVAAKPSDQEKEIARLQADLARLNAIAPNQPSVMTQVARHFNNLWFAAAERNWFDRAFDETAIACSACHSAIGKPYLRPGRPSIGLQFPPARRRKTVSSRNPR